MQLHRSLAARSIVLTLAACALLGAFAAAQGGGKKTTNPPIKLPTVPPVDVKASEGDTATAIRGKPGPLHPVQGGKFADINLKSDPWWFQHQGKIHFAADPSRPAVLLVHGLHQSSASWLQPSESGYNYDREHEPEPLDLGKQDYAGIGIEQIGFSGELEVDSKNWFDFLAAQGFTVATFSYSSERFGEAVATTTEALQQLASVTAQKNPGAPPPIALVGHSMGGLVIRATLKSTGALGRVRWVVTLCSPHQGSEMALAPEKLEEEAASIAAEVPLPPPLSQQLQQVARAIACGLVDRFAPPLDESSKELAPGSATMTALAEGEQALPGVEYFTFGGTDPNYTRVYAYVFDAMSSVPQFSGFDVFFAWTAVPYELAQVSPMLDKVRNFVPEVTPGQGDGLVADARASLPWSVHETLEVNHVEVLWHHGLQARVAAIVLGKPSKLVDVADWLAQVSTLIADAKGVVDAGGGLLEGAKDVGAKIGVPEGTKALAAWTVQPDATMKGRLGRLAVRYPSPKEAKSCYVSVQKAGGQERVEDEYGDCAFELMPGAYDVFVSNCKVASVPIQSRSETRVAVGLVHVQASSKTYSEILDATGEQRLADGYGERWYGLPIGKYVLRIASQDEIVVVEDGVVTEF